MTPEELAAFCLPVEGVLKDVILCLNQNQQGIALVLDSAGRLAGTVTDGDIRRAMLDDAGLREPVSDILKRKAGTKYERPVTLPANSSLADILARMQEEEIDHLPLLDSEGRPVDLAFSKDYQALTALPLRAVIMAGGFGTRLRPFTEDLPKPMLPVGERPLMAHIVDQLRGAGIQNLYVTTHFKPEQIVDYFGNGENFGVNISYLHEEQPLGTAGALSKISQPDGPLLVMNGDILTQLDFRSMLKFHREHEADLTVGVRQFDVEVPYGVVENEGGRVRAIQEKPTYSFLVNAGIYLLEPSVVSLIPQDHPFNMTDLIERLIKNDRKVTSFPIIEYWLDIGQHEDYRKAQDDVSQGRIPE